MAHLCVESGRHHRPRGLLDNRLCLAARRLFLLILVFLRRGAADDARLQVHIAYVVSEPIP